MKLLYKFLFVAATGWALTSCDKYLDVKLKGLVIPERLADYEAMLYSPTMTRTFPMNLLDFTDDYFNNIDALSQSPAANGYYWRPIITVNEKTSPDIWGPLYRVIYDANVIINGVPRTAEANTDQANSVIGEALVIRANCYLELITVFAKSYSPATAANTPGLPLVTSINVTDQIPARSSLKATVDTMIANVTRAIPSLPLTNTLKSRVTKYTAYALLSRIYLYMGDFENAEKYTDLALEAPHAMLDYNAYAASSAVPRYEQSPEVLWHRAAVSGSPLFMIYSTDLLSYFNSDDIRFSFLTTTNNNGLGRATLPGTYNFGITFPELYLTKAELLARKNQYDEAMDIVNMVRQNRIKTAAYVDQTASSGEEALGLVLAERRRELAFSGLRWFDMKRLDREGRMPEVKRINPDTQEAYAVLTPGSANYTFEIPVRVQLFNPGMELNHQ